MSPFPVSSHPFYVFRCILFVRRTRRTSPCSLGPSPMNAVTATVIFWSPTASTRLRPSYSRPLLSAVCGQPTSLSRIWPMHLPWNNDELQIPSLTCVNRYAMSMVLMIPRCATLIACLTCFLKSRSPWPTLEHGKEYSQVWVDRMKSSERRR